VIELRLIRTGDIARAIYIMDRGYLDYARLYKINPSAAYFVTQAKSNFNFQRLYSQKIDKVAEFKCDQVITLHVYYSKKDYPKRLRRIAYIEVKTGSLHNFTDCKRHAVPENPAIAISYRC
jgi:methionine synthase II (cobalamin-independent)